MITKDENIPISLSDIHKYINNLSLDEVRDLRNLCERVMRVKLKEIRKKRLEEQAKIENLTKDTESAEDKT